MKAIKTKLQETNPERVELFEKGAAAYAKKIVTNFKDYEFVSSCPTMNLLGTPESTHNMCYCVLCACHDPIVHWRVHEPRWHGASPQLPTRWYYSYVYISSAQTTRVYDGLMRSFYTYVSLLHCLEGRCQVCQVVKDPASIHTFTCMTYFSPLHARPRYDSIYS